MISVAEPEGAETFGGSRIRNLSFGSGSDKKISFLNHFHKTKQDYSSNVKSVLFQKSRKLDFFS
jgi:hypothetical protein